MKVGHNFFPMIINSDERQWTWMDEGLNTFVQFLAEQEWDRNYPSRRGAAKYIVPYMKSELNTLRPIMTNSEQILQFGNNAYGKPATALNILRETIMGRELFDYAFKEYSRRWAFKHPSPADFFRTMEDASAVDLDWFWKGWFYTVDKVDISVESVKWFQVEAKDPAVKNQRKKKEKEQESKNLSKMRNETDIKKTVVEANPDMLDFYNSYDAFQVTPKLEKRVP
jgi:aminopeptidase N